MGPFTIEELTTPVPTVAVRYKYPHLHNNCAWYKYCLTHVSRHCYHQIMVHAQYSFLSASFLSPAGTHICMSSRSLYTNCQWSSSTYNEHRPCKAYSKSSYMSWTFHLKFDMCLISYPKGVIKMPLLSNRIWLVKNTSAKNCNSIWHLTIKSISLQYIEHSPLLRDQAFVLYGCVSGHMQRSYKNILYYKGTFWSKSWYHISSWRAWYGRGQFLSTTWVLSKNAASCLGWWGLLDYLLKFVPKICNIISLWRLFVRLNYSLLVGLQCFLAQLSFYIIQVGYRRKTIKVHIYATI